MGFWRYIARFWAAVLGALDSVPGYPKRSTNNAAQAQPEGFDVHGKLVMHDKQVTMSAPGVFATRYEEQKQK